MIKRMLKKIVKTFFNFCLEIILFPILCLAALIAGFMKKKIDVGLGPDPLINIIYHKRALQLYGYSVETFVDSVCFITTEFDVRGDLISKYRAIKYLYLYFRVIFNYKSIYIYFNGGPLSFYYTIFIKKCEPFLYMLANVKVVVMPYGGDVQNLLICPNLIYKHTMSNDYPSFRFLRGKIASQVNLWTQYASHVISGCEWVYYMFHWDTLMLAHFSIDLEKFEPYRKVFQVNSLAPLRILHAPNHRGLKGTHFFIKAVEELQREGHAIELIIMEKRSNDEVLKTMSQVDLVADQLIVGWYAMFSIEAMSMGKPVLCYLRDDLTQLYENAGIVEKDEVPLIHCTPSTVKEVILKYVNNKQELKTIGEKSLKFVEKHHSLKSVGKVFDQINQQLGINKEQISDARSSSKEQTATLPIPD